RAADLAGTVGEELLKPTHIYVRPVLEAMRAGVDVRGLAHITSDGFLNLSRFPHPIGYVIDALPPPPPIFAMIQQCGQVPRADMFSTFNMGIGFCIVVSTADADRLVDVVERHDLSASVIGHAVADDERFVSL